MATISKLDEPNGKNGNTRPFLWSWSDELGRATPDLLLHSITDEIHMGLAESSKKSLRLLSAHSEERDR